MKTIITHSIYEANPWGNGAEKYTAQLDELFEQLQIRQIKYSRNGALNLSIYAWVRSVGIVASVYDVLRFSSLRVLARFWKNLAHELPSLDRFFDDESKIFFWESTKEYFYYLPFIAKKKNFKVIAFAHNLESLVPGQRTMYRKRWPIKRLNAEINVLKTCDIVCTISREDALMLKLLGVDSIYLPYYPPKATEDWLLSVRAMREKRTRANEKRVLAIGTTINPPTRMGIERLVKLFREERARDIRLFVAGFGSKRSATESSSCGENTTFLGELSPRDLQHEMVLADALLIYQPATTGVLTRITDFLIAGLPVVVNFEAARNHYGVDGVHVYQNKDEMFDLLNRELPVPTIIAKPTTEFNAFRERLGSLN